MFKTNDLIERKIFMIQKVVLLIFILFAMLSNKAVASDDGVTKSVVPIPDGHYKGTFIEGDGDLQILEAIDAAFESTRPSAKMACLPLLYKRDWNGFVEGPSWPGWWPQNSFGATYSMLPFMGEEPYASWIANSQALWFRLMGNNERKDVQGSIGPDGCLCDCVGIELNGGSMNGFGDFRVPGGGCKPVMDGTIHKEWTVYKQGDADPKATDWYIGATVAGLVMEADRLLMRHDPVGSKIRLAELKRVAAFLDTRRDPETNLLKGGHNSNLLAPSFRSVRKADGTFEFGYLTELSVNYVAGLERLAEVCLLCGEPKRAVTYRDIANKVRQGLPRLMTPEGYFIKSDESDGRHGVFGADKYGYFEAHPNHDAGAFRVTDDAANRSIVDFMLNKVKGTKPPGSLIPHGLVLPNYPGYDDNSTDGDQTYGTWVNGGVWPAHQGVMSIACLRAEEYNHPLNAWAAMRTMMEAFRSDAPLANWGTTPWRGQLAKPYCFCYDDWGAPGGILRGLFEYGFTAKGIRLWPHIPPALTRYAQKIPASFGKTRIYLASTGTGTVNKAFVNGKQRSLESDGSLFLLLNGSAEKVTVEFICGDARPRGVPDESILTVIPAATDTAFWNIESKSADMESTGKIKMNLASAGNFFTAMKRAGFEDTFEAGQARLVVELITAYHQRRSLAASGKLSIPDLKLSHRIPSANQSEVDKLYRDNTGWILGGLQDHLNGLSLWKYPVNPKVLKLAREAGL